MNEFFGFVFGGFISKAINDGVDFAEDKIRREVENKNDASLSAKVYHIIENILNEMTGNIYKNQDILYNATEVFFTSFRENKNNIEAIKCSLNMLISNVSNSTCEIFIEKFLCRICMDEQLYKNISLILQEQGFKYNQEELRGLNKKIETSFFQLNRKMDNIIQKADKEKALERDTLKKRLFQSRTEEYANRWHCNMFLNDFDKRDENAGINVKLKEVYLDILLPNYIWEKNKSVSEDLEKLLLEDIVENSENEMLLVLGQPGIGKSTLVTWIVSNFIEKKEDILVYQFATDLNDIDWKKSSSKPDLLYEIMNSLGLTYEAVDGKTLILDGFDEVSTDQNRAQILNQLYWKLKSKEKSIIQNKLDMKKDLANVNISLVIMCRENYIRELEKLQCHYITLQPWNDGQICSFCNVYGGKINNVISKDAIENILENRDVFGIPLVLYMVLALNIRISKKGSIVDVYDQIFTLDGGIYDRCINTKRYADVHWISSIKGKIHDITKNIALWMFENNPDEAYIPQKEYENICDYIIKEKKNENGEIKQDFKIGNFFKSVRHCEGIETEELSFVHRSIYEYFVVEIIYTSAESSILEMSNESMEELAGDIAIFLKKGKITYTIGNYLQYKLLKLYYRIDDKKRKKFYQWWELLMCKMINFGMFYYTKKNIDFFNNIITGEINCFMNMLEILRLLLPCSQEEYIMVNRDMNKLEKYIKLCAISLKHCNFSKLYLRTIDLRGVSLRGMIFRETDLAGANLEEVDLRGVDFTGACLIKANLEEANLAEANLAEADLRRADMLTTFLYNVNFTNTKLDMQQISYLRNKCNLNKTQVFIEDTKAYIPYEEYS